MDIYRNPIILDYNIFLGDIRKAVGICYDSGVASDDLIREVIEKGHTSVLEHSYINFKIKCSRVTSHQLVRHRIGFSYSQRSQRYVLEDEPSIFIPPNVKDEEAFFESCKQSIDAYKHQIDMGTPKEDARYLLPQVMTQIVFSCNLRSALEFIKLRTCARAQYEIRILAERIRSKLVEEFSFLDFNNTGPDCGNCKEECPK